jgi:hypothetical protein
MIGNTGQIMEDLIPISRLEGNILIGDTGKYKFVPPYQRGTKRVVSNELRKSSIQHLTSKQELNQDGAK